MHTCITIKAHMVWNDDYHLQWAITDYHLHVMLNYTKCNWNTKCEKKGVQEIYENERSFLITCTYHYITRLWGANDQGKKWYKIQWKKCAQK